MRSTLLVLPVLLLAVACTPPWVDGGSSSSTATVVSRTRTVDTGPAPLAPNEVDAANDPTLRKISEDARERGVRTQSPGWRTRVPPPPRFDLERDARYYWTLRTNHGRMKFRL